MKKEIECIEISIAYNEELPKHYGYYNTVAEAVEALQKLDKKTTSQRKIIWRTIYKHD